MDLPQAWNHQLDSNEAIQNLDSWWENLNDPDLNTLIEEARKNSPDMRIALSRITQAEAQFGVTASQRYPSVDATGSATRSKSSANETGAPSRTENFESIGTQLGWEIDLFGRVQRQVEAAEAEVSASVEEYRDVQVSLFAEIARVYVELRTLQNRLEIANKNVEAQKETLKIVNARFEAELVSDADVHRAKQNLAASQSSIPLLRAGLEQSMNNLAVLVGKNPGALHSQLSTPKPLPAVPTALVTSIPRDVLRQRPDVRIAERRLAAQSARIGVATADLYPRLSLSGAFSFATGFGGGGLLSAASQMWSFGPSLSWNVLDGGRTRSQISLEDARADEARIVYEKTVLGAFEDVENSIVNFSEEKNRLVYLEASAESAKKAVQTVQVQYQSGLTNFQSVLDAERVLLSQEDALADSRGALVRYLISIYRAMGGGWNSTEAAVQNNITQE